MRSHLSHYKRSLHQDTGLYNLYLFYYNGHMIKAVLFDLDGVLIDSEHLSQKIYEEFIQEFHYDIPVERFYLLIGSHKRWDPFRKVIEGYDIGLTPEEFEEKIVKYRLDKFNAYDISTLGFKDAKETLLYLKEKGIKTAVASSSSIDYVERMLVANGIDHLFDLKTTGDDFKRPKPEPDIYLYCKDKLNVDIDECLVVEDSPLGIKAGKNAKMKVIAKRDDTFGFDQSEADFFINDLSELKRILR